MSLKEPINREYCFVDRFFHILNQPLEKMPYLASENITKKWIQRYRGWD